MLLFIHLGFYTIYNHIYLKYRWILGTDSYPCIRIKTNKQISVDTFRQKAITNQQILGAKKIILLLVIMKSAAATFLKLSTEPHLIHHTVSHKREHWSDTKKAVLSQCSCCARQEPSWLKLIAAQTTKILPNQQIQSSA